MERDIRDLFKDDEHSRVELPKNHKEDFIKKLEEQHRSKYQFIKSKWLKIAVSFLLIFSASTYYFIDNAAISKSKENAFQVQVKAIEKEYLQNIDNEWKEFLAISNDSILIKKYETKLLNFDLEYQKITKQLNEFPNNIYILEMLINNLQRRLELIKSIKEHIKELNQKNTSNETIYL